MRQFLSAVVIVVAFSACGGGAPPSDVVEDPIITASPDPADDVPLNGIVQIVLTAQGQGVDLATFVFEAPASVVGTAATFDTNTHRASLSASIQTRDHLDGLVVRATATDVKGHSTPIELRYRVDPTARVLSLDPAFPSYRSEANLQVTRTVDHLAVPGGVYYASSDKVAIAPGGNVYKAVTRTGWGSTAPSTAELENANSYNIPILRILAERRAGDPDVASAKATVGIGSEQASAVTLDLLPATASPAGQMAYLLPLASNHFPFLSRLTGPTELKITAELTDALGNVARANGGSFTVNWVPLPPPVTVHLDTGYATAGDPLSAYPYLLANDSPQSYAALWSGASTPDDGRRVHHVILSNPDPVNAVSIGAILGGANGWSILETWPALKLVVTTRSFSCTNSQGGQGCVFGAPGPCDPDGATPVSLDLGDLTTASWSCVAASWGAGPAAKPFGRTGLLRVTGYENGSATPAQLDDASRFVIPPATEQAAGRLDLYVVRPATSDRTDGPSLTWSEGGYRTSPTYTAEVMTNKSIVTGSSSATTTWTWTRTTWGWRLGSVVESISGTLSLDAQAHDGAAGYGPTASAASPIVLSTTITH